MVRNKSYVTVLESSWILFVMSDLEESHCLDIIDQGLMVGPFLAGGLLDLLPFVLMNIEKNRGFGIVFLIRISVISFFVTSLKE